jgi:hypothetical protein
VRLARPIVAYPRQGTTADVWSYRGRDPREALAVHVDGKVCRVMVAQRPPDAHVDQLLAEHLLNAGAD